MKTFFKLLLSVVLSFLTLLIPWENLRSADFADRNVYYNYVYNGVNILEYTDFTTLSSYFSAEFLWHFILLYIDNLMTYEDFFYLTSLLTLAMMFFYLIRNFSILSFLLVFNPLILDLVLSQYRLSFAVSLVLISVYLKNHKIISYTIFLCSLFIHSSIAIFLLIYLAINILTKFYNAKPKILLLLLCLTGIVISWILSGQIYAILSFLGDRRSEYDLERVSSSISYLSFWILNLLFLSYHSYKYGFKSLDSKLSILVLSLISANIVFGGYSTRILAVFLPVIFKANLEINTKIKSILFFIYFVYTTIQWSYWLA